MSIRDRHRCGLRHRAGDRRAAGTRRLCGVWSMTCRPKRAEAVAGAIEGRRQGRACAGDVRRRPMRRKVMAAAVRRLRRSHASRQQCRHRPPGALRRSRQPADFDRMFAVHVRGTFLLHARRAARHAGAQGGRDRQYRFPARPDRRHRTRPLFRRQGRDHRHDQGAGARGQRRGRAGQRRGARPHQHAAGRWRCRTTGARPRPQDCRSAASANRRRWPRPSPSSRSPEACPVRRPDARAEFRRRDAVRGGT